MPWLTTTFAGDPPEDELLGRIAHHLKALLQDPSRRTEVSELTGITERTLYRYARCDFDERGRLDQQCGPRKTEYLIRICAALGENTWRLFWAATYSTDYASMVEILSLPHLPIPQGPGLAQRPEGEVVVLRGPERQAPDPPDIRERDPPKASSH